MIPASDDDLLAMYDKVSDALVIAMTRRCLNQLLRRRLISFDDTIEVLSILHIAIDNAIDANEALNKANAILRGDL